MAISHVCKGAIWILKLCLDEGLSKRAITIHSDGNNIICLAKNSTFHVKIKHIDIYYDFVLDMIKHRKVVVEKVDTF